MPILKTSKFFPNQSLSQKLLLFLASLLVMLNLVSLGRDITRRRAERKERPYIFLGNKYLGLDAFLKPVDRVGFLTDRDMNDLAAAMEFAQAEYVLVPVKLDKQSPAHEYVILSFDNPLNAMRTVQQYQLTPLRQNQFGVILARNPKAQNR
jgi:hypothetical protein